MAIELNELIELLNKDLGLEYTAIVQYVQHSGVLTGAEYGDITKEIKIHTTEELQHALVLTEQIDYLGGFPTAVMPPAATSKDNREMLQQDLTGEEDAISRYKQRIVQAEELMELALAQKLREILSVEQEHAMDLRNALGK
ncbi:MAG: ferritin-like domain-containing protein [Dehalococcoidales bacterium]|jgi:bacterioferritin|nr:ferritin [Dehalococcoidales bacterium]MDP6126568.1 ferritin-like domain-containing protein [Dehalococcoidales bacterium]|tara:strand:- start:987 stop:1409 length:423 start_codon:yes stop_codon:yes gene_type:complete